CSSNDGVSLKKARVQASSAHSLLKVLICFELPVPAIWIKEHDTVLPSLKCRLPHDHLHQQDADGEPKNLRSRGLCLVPVSFILHVGNHNGADFWADSFGMGLR
ncbi:hypothetical protein GW17_00037180, partial [Ensete ventricosum]